MTPTQPSGSDEVFISYSHDSADHIEQVLELSNRLRADGVDCVLDQYEVSPPEDWPRWMDKKIRDAKYVVLVCTEPYQINRMNPAPDSKYLEMFKDLSPVQKLLPGTGSASSGRQERKAIV